MKSLTTLLFMAMTGVAVASDATVAPNHNDAFLLTPEYRVVVHLNESALSPFRKPEARAAQAAALAKNSGPNVPAVLAKFHEMGLTGVIPSTATKPGLIILGGIVYHEGDELVTHEGRSRSSVGLIAEHKVTLRSVTPTGLALSVGHAGETEKQPLNVPIALLEFRQR